MSKIDYTKYSGRDSQISATCYQAFKVTWMPTYFQTYQSVCSVKFCQQLNEFLV